MDSFTLLLIEHDHFDIKCFERAMQGVNVPCNLIVVKTPEEALQLLLNRDVEECIRRPYIIFCDINMPHAHGVDFLMKVRSTSLIKNSVFFLCSSSFKSEDLAAARDYKVSGFMKKIDIKRGLSVTMQHLSMSRRLAV